MTAVILAAGENSRFWPLGQDKHKSMYEVGSGSPVLFYTLYEINKAGIKEVIIVTRDDDFITKNYCRTNPVPDLNISLVSQKSPLGMGDALLQARKLIEKEDVFLVLNPNHINCREIIRKILAELKIDHSGVIIAGQKTLKPWVYGILEVHTGRVISIEEKPANPKSNIRIVGIYCLPRVFLDFLANFSGHYGFELALQEFIVSGHEVRCLEIPEDFRLFSLKYPWDLLAINKFLMKRDFAGDLNYSNDGINIKGPVVLGKFVKFLGHASIKGPCYIGNNVTIGDYAVIRDHSSIGDGCIIGCKTEIKNSILGSGVHAHGSFIGDSIIGNNCRLGAGTIIANRRSDGASVKSTVKSLRVDTGLISFGMVMGSDSKTGINASIMPGVKIGQRSIVGPQTLVNEDIEDDRLYYSTHTANKKIIRRGE